MVFSSKLKVCKGHSNESSDDEKNDEDYKENAVYGVNSMAPNTGKYVVKFNIYGTKREKPGHCHLWNSPSIPRQRWNLPWILSCATWSLELSPTVFPGNATQNKQRRRYKRPYENDNHNCAKWQCCSSTVCYSNGIKEAEGQEQWPTEKAACQY